MFLTFFLKINNRKKKYSILWHFLWVCLGVRHPQNKLLKKQSDGCEFTKKPTSKHLNKLMFLLSSQQENRKLNVTHCYGYRSAISIANAMQQVPLAGGTATSSQLQLLKTRQTGSLLCCPATDYNCCPAEFILTKGKKGRTNNKSLTIVMSNLYLSSIAWLSWHPASSCQISALSASGTPLFTRVDNPFGLTTRLLCLKQRWTFSCYTSTTGVKIKMKSIKNL